MINSISSMASSMTAMQRQPPPPEKDAFKIADSDSDGLVNGAELESILEGISEVTGSSISSDSALSSFDTDGDGGLNGEELFELMSENGFQQPQGLNGEAGPPPPPPPSMDQALGSYAQNSGEDLVQQLMDLLQDDDSAEEETSSINVLS